MIRLADKDVHQWPGRFVTAVVTAVFAITKFQGGAWIVIILIPIW